MNDALMLQGVQLQTSPPLIETERTVRRAETSLHLAFTSAPAYGTNPLPFL